jgi:hypothetical protein
MIEKVLLQKAERAERMRVKDKLQKEALEKRELVSKASYKEALRLAWENNVACNSIYSHNKRYLPSDSPLRYAVRKGEASLLQLIISSPGFNAEDYDNPIGSAVNEKVLKILINAGFKVNGKFNDAGILETYLHQIVFSTNNKGMVKLMLDAGCETEGSNVIYLAHDPEILSMLLEYGFDMNLKGKAGAGVDAGMTPVSWFLKCENYKCAEMIIKAGCDCNIQDSSPIGDSPLHIACKIELKSRDDENPNPPHSWKLDVIKLLIEYGGADVALINNHDKIASEYLGPSENDIKQYLDNTPSIRFNHGFKR